MIGRLEVSRAAADCATREGPGGSPLIAPPGAGRTGLCACEEVAASRDRQPPFLPSAMRILFLRPQKLAEMTCRASRPRKRRLRRDRAASRRSPTATRREHGRPDKQRRPGRDTYCRPSGPDIGKLDNASFYLYRSPRICLCYGAGLAAGKCYDDLQRSLPFPILCPLHVTDYTILLTQISIGG